LYRDITFEIQIRTIVQDSWSNLDHKIKYKKSIPNSLKRRINTLAALFEQADREFRQVRDATFEEIEKAESESNQTLGASAVPAQVAEVAVGSPPLNAFSFVKIAKHYFAGFDFEDLKVDAFTSEIVQHKRDITRGDFDYYMRQNIAKVRKYQGPLGKSSPNDVSRAYVAIRHCLYLGDPEVFAGMLTNADRESFKSWRAKHDKD
jgi:putative GTP pyrophosphokinase